jgi:hypothetical protein
VQQTDLSPEQQFLDSLKHRVPQGIMVLYESITREVHVFPGNASLEESIWMLSRALAILQESLPKPQPAPTLPQTPEELEAEIKRRTEEELRHLGLGHLLEGSAPPPAG